MQTTTLLFGVFLLVATVSARHYEERLETDRLPNDRDDVVENFRRSREHGASQRHRRRAWHSSMNPNYGYDYNVPPNPYYPDYRNDQSQQDLLPQIYRLLDEISAYVKRPPMLPPPPPPQPIYIPYAVPYPVPQACKCKKEQSKPNITNRFSDMEDDNQNWGLVDSNEGAGDEDENDGSRPISFVPIQAATQSKRTKVNVEHGSSQAGSTVTQSPSFAQEGRVPAKLPGKCEVFSLSCCNGSPQQQKQCFINVGCSSAYDNGKGCNQQRLLTIIDAYSQAYSPVN